MTLAECLRLARKKKGWSQDTLARHAGVVKQTVANHEGGKGAEYDSIYAYSRAFGTWAWLDPTLTPVDSGDAVTPEKLPAAA